MRTKSQREGGEKQEEGLSYIARSIAQHGEIWNSKSDRKKCDSRVVEERGG
jgi:hypothetical protein